MDYTLTHSLLQKHLDTKAKPEEIAKCLSLCGPTVDRLHKLDDDYLYEIEVITNRVDAASARGIAREAAAILPEFGIEANLKPLDLDAITQTIQQNTNDFGIEIVNDPKLNHRILAIKIANVTIGESPNWLKETLEHLGSRSLNNVIDITNYVMWELGHPIHAFDYDRITTKKIIVREAKAGEKFTTLDEQTHTCTGGEIVYDDGTGNIIDLPGIMGTANTVITPETKNVLLWIESNDPKKIRKASLQHQIRTQAAILNEKSVDPNLGYDAIRYGALLLTEIANGTIASKLVDIYPHPIHPHTVTISTNWLNQFAGVAISTDKVLSILKRLDINSTCINGELTCTIPTNRVTDIRIKEDLAEEIMRVFGYFRLPSIIPQTDLPKVPTENALKLEQTIKHQLVKQGGTEVFNLSLIDEQMLKTTNVAIGKVFTLANPLSADHTYMRPSLIPSLTANLKHNKGTFEQPYMLFELANTYSKDPNGPLAKETPTLGLAWYRMTYRQVKGHLDALFAYLHVTPNYQPLVLLDDQTYVYELSLENILVTASTIHTFTPIPEFTPIIEDLTFTVPSSVHIGPLMEAIKKSHSLINLVELKDIYKQNATFTINYYDPTKQLATSDIAPVRKQVVDLLMEKWQCKLVGDIT